MKITLGITAYREGKLLENCINGMLNQTLQDWKGFIVLDGGHDQISREIVEKVDDPRITKIILEKNIGPYPARELIFKQCETDVILHCDGDDVLRPDAAKLVSEIFSDDKVNFAGFGVQLNYENGEKIIIPGHKTTLNKFILDSDFPGYTLFRKSMWVKYGGYNQKLYSGRADFDFMLKLIGNDEPFAFLPETIIDKTEREGSVSRSYHDNVGYRHFVVYKDNQEIFKDNAVKTSFLFTAFYMSFMYHLKNKNKFKMLLYIGRIRSNILKDMKLSYRIIFSLPVAFIVSYFFLRSFILKNIRN